MGFLATGARGHKVGVNETPQGIGGHHVEPYSGGNRW